MLNEVLNVLVSLRAYGIKPVIDLEDESLPVYFKYNDVDYGTLEDEWYLLFNKETKKLANNYLVIIEVKVYVI